MTQSELSDLQDANPGWHIWQSSNGTGMATRIFPEKLTDPQIFEGMAMTLMAGPHEKPLAEQLTEQRKVEQRLIDRTQTVDPGQ